MPYGDGRYGEDAFAEVKAQDRLRIGNRRERGLLIPAQEKIDVRADLLAKPR